MRNRADSGKHEYVVASAEEIDVQPMRIGFLTVGVAVTLSRRAFDFLLCLLHGLDRIPVVTIAGTYEKPAIEIEACWADEIRSVLPNPLVSFE